MPELFNSSPDTATQGFTPPPAANDERYDNVVAFSVAEQAGDTADATAQYAESFLPEGTLDIAGHGFAEVPQQDLAPELAAETTPTSLDINLDELTPPIIPDINLNFDGKVDIDPTELRGIEVPNWELVPMTPNSGTVGTEAAPALPLTAEATPAAPINAKEKVGDDILASYKERFGINPEDLEGIEGFNTLSRGQQKQALENLAQLTIGRIHEEAIDGQAEDIAQQKKNAKFLGKVWISLKDSFTKKYNVIGREKQLAADIQKGGIDTHKAVLAQMVSGMKELGPEIKEGADGALEVQYIETGGLSPEVAKVAEVFNEQATKLSKIPHDWGMETATPAQQQAYKEAQDIYQLQRGVLMKHMSDAGGDAMALKAIAKTESQMEMQRFIQTCPDAAEELKGIKNEKAWKEALKSVGTERGLYFAGGAAARTALGLMGGLVFAPIVAAGIAGMRGWKRSGEALLAQDKAQQRGEVIITPKMQAARDRMARINDELAHVDTLEVKTALTAELGTLESAALGTTKNMIAAVREEGDNESGYRGSSEKMNALVMKIKAAEAQGEDTSTLQAKLKRRIDYTNLKIAEGKMVFGDSNERLGNQYTLTKAMSTAEVMLAGETVTDEHGDKAERRLAKLLDKSEEETNDARFKKKVRDTLFAGTIGGVAASAGAEFADAVKWMNGAGGTMSEKMFGSAADLKAHIAEAGTSVMGAAKEFGENLEQTALGAAQSLHAQLATGASTVSTEYVDGSRGLATEQPYIPYGETLRSATEASPDYPVVQGDNLSKIFAREIPGSTNHDVYRALKGMTPEELTKLGVTSGNIDLIHLGDKINVEMMKEYIAAHPGAGVAEAGAGGTPEAPYSHEGRGGGTGGGGESGGPEADGHVPLAADPSQDTQPVDQMKHNIPRGEPVLREASFHPNVDRGELSNTVFNPDADFHFVPTSATMPQQTVSIDGNMGKALAFAERTLNMTPGKLTAVNLAEQNFTNSFAPNQEAAGVHGAAANAVAEAAPANIKPEVMRNLDEYTLKKMNETRKVLGALADQPATEIVPRVQEGPSYDRFKVWEKNGIVPKKGETLIEYEGRGFKDEMLKKITVGADAERAAIEKTSRIAGGWSDVATNGPSHNSHWGEVRGQSLRNAASAPLGVKDASSLEAARAEMHALLGKAEAMGFHATEKETTAGAFLDRVAKELHEPLTSERAMVRSHEIYKVIYNQVPIHGQLRLVSAEAIVRRNLLPGIADTPEGKEFLAWKSVLLATQKNTGVSPAPNEDLQSYIERATRVALHKDPTLHASTLIGRKIDEAGVVTPRSAPVMPVRVPQPAEADPPPLQPAMEKPHVLEQPAVAARTVPKEALLSTHIPENRPNVAFQPGHELMRDDLRELYTYGGSNAADWKSIKYLRADVVMDSKWDTSVGPDAAAVTNVRSFLAEKGISIKTHPPLPDETTEHYFSRVRANTAPVGAEAVAPSRVAATEIRPAPYPGMEDAAKKLGVKPEDMDKMMATRVPAAEHAVALSRAETQVLSPEVMSTIDRIAKIRGDMIYANFPNHTGLSVSESLVKLREPLGDKMLANDVQQYIDKGYRPKSGETLEQFYPRVVKEELLKNPEMRATHHLSEVLLPRVMPPAETLLLQKFPYVQFPRVSEANLRAGIIHMEEQIDRTPTLEELKAYFLLPYNHDVIMEEINKNHGAPLSPEQIQKAIARARTYR